MCAPLHCHVREALTSKLNAVVFFIIVMETLQWDDRIFAIHLLKLLEAPEKAVAVSLLGTELLRGTPVFEYSMVFVVFW